MDLSTIYPNDSESEFFHLFNQTNGLKSGFWPFRTAKVKMLIMKLLNIKKK